MTRDLRLRTPDDFNEIADAELLVAHQVQDPEPGLVAKCLKEPLEVEWGFLCHVYIFALTHSSVNISGLADVFCGEKKTVRAKVQS